MMCTAIMSVLKYKIKALMTQAHFGLNNLEGPFLGFTEERMQNDILGEFGLGAIFKSFKSEPITKNIIEECSVSIIKNDLSLLPGHYIGDYELFRYDMELLLSTVIHKIDDFYDYIFVDTPTGKNIISDMMIEQSDLVVVNLNQNPGVVDNFFQNYSFWEEKKKVFYIIGDYDCNLKYNYRYILQKYPLIKYENSAVIPYNTEFRDSLIDASTVSFFQENYKKEYMDKYEKNYFFMTEVAKATKKMLKMLGETKRRQD